MADIRMTTGLNGEEIGRRFLSSRGYKIVSQNYRTPFGEIDIIAREKNCLVFVEVRTRTSRAFGSPLSSIDRHKKKRIIKNCKYFLSKLPCDTECRIDMIGILLDSNGDIRVLRHIKNAIYEEIQH